MKKTRIESKTPRFSRTTPAAVIGLLGAVLFTLPVTAQTPIVLLDTLVANHGSVTAGKVTFSNFQKPTVLPRPLGAFLTEFNDIGVSATANADGSVTLNFLFIDPATGLATPVVTGGDVTRLITYTATVNDPAVRLHMVTQAFGPLTTGFGTALIYDMLYHVDPALVAFIGSPIYNALIDYPSSTGQVMLPGGDPPSTTMTNEFGVLKGHLGLPAGATVDLIGLTFMLAPVGSPVPPVVANLAQKGEAVLPLGGALWLPNTFLNDSVSGIVQLVLNNYAQDGGAVIGLTTDNPGLLTIPPTVTIPQGNFVSLPVVPVHPEIDFPIVVNLTATFNGRTQTQAYTVNPTVPLAVTNFSAGTPGCFNGPCAINTSMRIGFFLNRTNVSAETVTLTSSNPEICPVPASITVPAFTVPTVAWVITLTCNPVAVNTPITYTGTLNGVVSTTTATFPRTIDSVSINKAELVVKNLSLKVEAGNQVPNDVLTLYNNATGQLIGNMTYVGLSGGGGKYSFQGTLSAPVSTLLLKSALNGSTTFAVSQK